MEAKGVEGFVNGADKVVVDVVTESDINKNSTIRRTLFTEITDEIVES